MLLGVREPESWLMDCSPPPVAWELLPPPGEEMEGGAGVAGGGGSRFRRAEPSREPAMCHQGLDILHILM